MDFTRPLLFTVAILSALAVTANAGAQEPEPAEPDTPLDPSPPPAEPLPTIPLEESDPETVNEPETVSPRNRLVDEIVVTARKREERIADVPLSIAAFSEEMLDAAGIESAQQLDKVTPGLVFTSTLGFNVVFLRGVGTDAYLPSADPSVPIYIDDVAILPTQGSVDTLGEIERVEVLKGPQGTLFGRNSLGGAVRIVTKEPDDEDFSGSLTSDFGNFNKRSYSGDMNVPLAEGLAFNASGFYSEQDPYYTNELDFRVYDIYSRGGRAAIKWHATDTLDFKLSGSGSKSSTIAGLISEGTRPSQTVCAVCTSDPDLDYNVRNNTAGGSITSQYLVSGQANWKLPWFATKLIASRQKLEIDEASTDLDGTETPIVTAFTDAEFGKQDTAEFRIESDSDTPFGDRFNWVAGAFYLKSSGGYHPVQFAAAQNALTIVPQLQDFNDQLTDLLAGAGISIESGTATLLSTGILHTKSVSGFTQGSLTFLEDFELTLGVRYDVEDRSLRDSRLGVINPVGGEEAVLLNYSVPEISTSRTSPRVSLKWQVADETQIYASYAIGYLSPTYNSVNFFVPPDLVKQEQSDAYELGFKGSFLSGAVKLEGALFYTERQDIISAYTNINSGVAVRFYNGGDGEVKGAELSLTAQPLPSLNPGLVLVASGSYLDAKYTSFPVGRGFDDDTGLGFGPDSPTGAPREFAGNRIVNSPRFTGTVGLVQSMAAGRDGSLEVGVDTYYNSGFFFDPQNSAASEQDSYQLLNARVSYFYDPWRVQITAYGQNLTEPEYLAAVFRFDTGTTYQLAPPRAYGLRVKWDF